MKRMKDPEPLEAERCRERESLLPPPPPSPVPSGSDVAPTARASRCAQTAEGPWSHPSQPPRAAGPEAEPRCASIHPHLGNGVLRSSPACRISNIFNKTVRSRPTLPQAPAHQLSAALALCSPGPLWFSRPSRVLDTEVQLPVRGADGHPVPVRRGVAGGRGECRHGRQRLAHLQGRVSAMMGWVRPRRGVSCADEADVGT